ncbi:hypothetical protein [Streptomyces chartreusis]|uniref:Uncharacterized protein n=1 Tax=Streptomyces chartreusis TaxID=1969 RepID=A0A7H8TFA3_STRCX|nr:hypothetical protein [Streptomyces chartreusis]QKZ22057.1 hypothetical protein HUT05_34740 [Streptomyces chartreusis]
MNPTDALRLVQRLLTDALEQPDKSTTYVRDLAARNGALKASIRAALVVIDTAGVEK